MATFVYMSTSASIRKFLQAIQMAGVPDKLTLRHLESLGFKTKNDRALLSIMKAIGFVSPTGEPTGRWQEYRNKARAGAVLAEGLHEHYADLFKTYPDAHLKDNEALHNFFSTHTSVGAGALRYMIATFKTLADMAEFGAPPRETVGVGVTPIAEPAVSVSRTARPGVGITINIQLTLPEGSTAETFDAFFKAMREHLPLE